MTDQTLELPKGTYLVSDPCCILSDAQCEEIYDTDLDIVKIGNIIAMRTPHGDGEYKTYLAHNNPKNHVIDELVPIGVDSGYICIAPLEVCVGQDDFDEKAYIKIEATQNIDVSYIMGVMHFGTISVSVGAVGDLFDEDFTVDFRSDIFEKDWLFK